MLYIKYLIRNLVLPILLIIFSLTSIIWLTQSLRFVDLIVNRGLDFTTFLYLSSLLIPSLLIIILPVSLFSGVIFVYNKFIMDSELIVLRNAGLSEMALAKPAFIVAMIATLLAYFITLYLSPVSYRELKDMQAFIRDNYASVLLQEGVFNSPVQGLTVYIQAREKGGMLKGILVHDERIPGKSVTMMAQQGKLVQTPAGPRFDLINGNRQQISSDEQLSLLYFDYYSLDLSTYTHPAGNRWHEPDERFLNELFYPTDPKPGMLGKLRAEGHQRLSWPLYNLVFTAIGLAAMFSGQLNRRGQWKRILAATAAVLIVLVVGIGLNNLSATYAALAPLIYINAFSAFTVAMYILLWPQLRKSVRAPAIPPSAV